jgi:hypothetical protein
MNTVPRRLVKKLYKHYALIQVGTTRDKLIRKHIKSGNWIGVDVYPTNIALALYSKEPIFDEYFSILGTGVVSWTDGVHAFWVGVVGEFSTIEEFLEYFKINEEDYLYYKLSGDANFWKFKIA